MKRFLCILLSLLLMAPAALADGYTPSQLLRQQFITGGNGLRGTATITASGVADWIDILLPFAAGKLQVRIIGEAQGPETDMVTDDDDWQIKFWAKDAQGNQHGMSYLYGTPEGIFFRSELLPDTLLTLPVKQVNLPYQLNDGDILALMNALNPLNLPGSSETGNVTAWNALARLFDIDAQTWEDQWAPVVDKYETLMDIWLADYAAPTVVSGSAGSMTLRTSYEIPVEDLKAQTKYIIQLMMTDVELLTLISPCLTDEQRSLYLNPAMLWFYEHCIDVVPLSGAILLEREMTTKGDTTVLAISLPIPPLPQTLTGPLGEMIQQTFMLPYANALDGVERVSIRQAGNDLSISLTSPQYTITLQSAPETAEEGVQYAGFLRITPAVGNDQPPLSAAFTYAQSQRIWEDEEYNTHEDYTWALELTPDLSLVSPEDAFSSTYVEFAPLSFSLQIGYTMKDKIASPVQVALSASATLADAELTLSASLKVAERWAHDVLPVEGGEDVTNLSPERKEALRQLFIENATQTMLNVNAVPAQ